MVVHHGDAEGVVKSVSIGGDQRGGKGILYRYTRLFSVQFSLYVFVPSLSGQDKMIVFWNEKTARKMTALVLCLPAQSTVPSCSVRCSRPTPSLPLARYRSSASTYGPCCIRGLPPNNQCEFYGSAQSTYVQQQHVRTTSWHRNDLIVMAWTCKLVAERASLSC